MNIDDKLSKLFDITPSSCEVITSDGHVIAPKDAAYEHDYDTSRNNLHTLLQQGQDALFNALEVAKQSEAPRAYEVVGSLMKQLADINHQLLDLHQKKHNFEKGNPQESKQTSSGAVTNNAIFVGSTANLSALLNDLRKGK